MRAIEFARRHVGYLAALTLSAAAVTLLVDLPAITARAAVPLLLLVVLLVARTWGTGPALLASMTVSTGYAYFFLPFFQATVLTSEELFVAFATFTASALVVGELAARAERDRREAVEKQREIERLYQELEAAFDRASEAEAARRSEQLKSALLDALTHNLRTPLTAIKASVTALKGTREASVELSGEGRRELLQVIDEESDRLNRFIAALSAVDTPDPSEPMRFRPVPLDQIVRAALTRATTITRRHHVRVRLHQDLQPLAVDAAAIVEVLYILLDNGSKYSPEGTEIQLSAAPHDAHFVRVAVIDEGPGIPSTLHERVFEKFFQVQGREPVDPSRVGVGLGLPIARRLVESQSGHIWIEGNPSPKGGTAVIMTLPLADEVVAEPSEEPRSWSPVPQTDRVSSS